MKQVILFAFLSLIWYGTACVAQKGILRLIASDTQSFNERLLESFNSQTSAGEQEDVLKAKSDDQVAFPFNYRNWVHVRSALVDIKSPSAGRYGGLHHIYANEKAMEGYRTGKFPDGAVIVFDLLETTENAGTTVEGPRKFIDVMRKESKRYAETGGWGFEEFVGDSQTERALTSEAKAKCYGCHTKRESHDFVFSEFRK